MFCARCGEQIADSSKICPLCGREAELKVDPPQAMTAAGSATAAAPGKIQWSSEPAVTGQPMRSPELKGVGGWLLFYCISLTTLGPALVLLGDWFAIRLHGINSEISLGIARMLYGIMVGIFLWMRRPLALMLLNIYFMVIAASFALLLLEMFAYSLRIHRSIFLSTQFPSLMTSAATSLLWFAYFCRSVRIKNTYGRNLLDRVR